MAYTEKVTAIVPEEVPPPPLLAPPVTEPTYALKLYTEHDDVTCKLLVPLKIVEPLRVSAKLCTPVFIGALTVVIPAGTEMEVDAPPEVMTTVPAI